MTTLLNHVESGSGEPCLIFVHGLACALDDWDAQREALSLAHRCIAVDLPGHGASPANGALSISRFGAALTATMTALQATPAVLVGHSMGCRVVLDAARRLGNQVAGVVLIDGSVRSEGDPQVARDETRASIQASEFAPYLERLFRVMFVNQDDLPLQERIVQRALRLDASAGTELIADLAAWDAGEMAAALDAQRAPVLVVQAAMCAAIAGASRSNRETRRPSWSVYLRRYRAVKLLLLLISAISPCMRRHNGLTNSLRNSACDWMSAQMIEFDLDRCRDELLVSQHG
jgi:pimeloyl-ACP methyl ester carboxylesterase